MKNKSLHGSMFLLLAAAIWGAAFVAQRAGMDHVGPLTFNGIRMLLGSLAMCPVIFLSDRTKPVSAPTPQQRRDQRTAGCLCGLLLFAASTLQQIGLVTTTAGKAGFITALYVVLVPVAAWLIFHRNPGKWIWVSVLLAVLGLFLICVPAGQNFTVSGGDLAVMGCAVCFTGHILTVDYYSPRVDGLRLSRDQFLICGILCLVPAFFLETISVEGLREALIPILYTGVLSGAVGYTLQILGQRNTHPTVASLVMSLESVFAVLTGSLLLGERMSPREGFGCLLMFCAVVLAHLSPLLASLLRRSWKQKA